MAKVNINIEVEVKNPLDQRSVENALQKLASLSFEDRQRITEILTSPKALKALADKWTMLKLMFK